MDLTRTIPPTTPNTDKSSCRKLAFSVENILDPNKFCSRKENQNSRHWINNGFERDDRHQMDDDQSESQSGKIFFRRKKMISQISWFYQTIDNECIQ